MKEREIRDIRALIVDDSGFFAEMTADTLTDEHGIDTAFETSAQDALETLDNTDIDCIVSDYQMPGMDGLEFLDAVHERFGDVPFILLTGRGDEEIASEAIASGVSDYLLKLEVVEDEQYERLAERIRNIVSRAQTRKMYELLVNNSPDLIAHVDESGEILTANSAMAELLEMDESALSGKSLREVFPDAIGEERLEAGQDAIETGEPLRTEDHYDGRYFHNIFVPVEGRSTELTFQMISRDITERKEREKALERQNERLDRFASVVSHDLRNPLNVASNSLDTIDLDADDGNVERLARSLDRMETIIEDVLTLARQGESVSQPSPVDFETMVEDAWSYVDTEDATLEIEDNDHLHADASRLKELLANLFRNAVEHGHSDGRDSVTVSAGLTADGFYIADDGTGISEDQLDVVFDAGYTTQRDGTGLGLSIVDEIARAHDWHVSVDESDAGGARFDITGVEFH